MLNKSAHARLVKPFHYITPLAGRNLIVALHRCPGENVGEVPTSNKRMGRRGERRTGRRLKYQGGVHERNRLAGLSLSLPLPLLWMWSQRDETVAGRARVQITRLPVQFCKTGFSCKISGQWASGSLRCSARCSTIAAFSSSRSPRCSRV